MKTAKVSKEESEKIQEKDIIVEEKKKKTTKKEKTPKTKVVRKKKTEVAKNETKEEIKEEIEKDKTEEILEEPKTKKSTSSKKEIKIENDEVNNLMNLRLQSFNCKIDVQKDNYNFYYNKDKSSLISNYKNLQIICKKKFVYIERVNDRFLIETNQNFELNYVVSELKRVDDITSFYVSNLAQLEIEDKKIKLIIDELKIAENSTQSNSKLIISEVDGKVYLPYTKEELKKAIQKSNNSNIEEVINQNYVVPIEKYKNSIIARYHEGYTLMREREKKSKKQAVLLGLELMFEFNLHPAIITACKNLEQLDIYLDCLEDNELEKFSCFKIIYKVLPTLGKIKEKNKLKNVDA